MCGITGLLSTRGLARDDLATIAGRMTDTLRHRGPDDGGVWVDEAAGVALGFRRLAIIDLSETGHQPMVSPRGRYVVVFNGELYNFQQLREDVLRRERITFRGRSDTEVMLAIIEQLGVETALQEFNGMFAFALWDRAERVLYLARDRFGEKPLYYSWTRDGFVFGSELKALRAHPGFKADIDRDALALYLRYQYVPAPLSIYREVYKLPPATWLRVDPRRASASAAPVPYWSAWDVVEEGLREPFRGGEGEAVAALDVLLRDAVKLRMVSDVPLGAFLSGGVDSSTIVALMQAQSSLPVRTFSIGFREPAYDEATNAKAVAAHLGSDHTELYVLPREAQAVIPRLPTLYDEPFADSSQIPTFLVAQLARRAVTVSLSGDGGDELFGGYNRYAWGAFIRRFMGWMPPQLRKATASGLRGLRPHSWDGLLHQINPLLPRAVRLSQPGEKLFRLGEILSAARPEDLYQTLVSHWKNPTGIVVDASEPAVPLTSHPFGPPFRSFTSWMMFLDSITYLPDDILVKVDRASMGTSLEARVPYLDPRVYALAWSVPLSMKVRGDQTKWLLRQVLYQYVPPPLIDRPKMGFGIPIGAWLRGPLREWAEGLLDERRLRAEGYFQPQPIRQKWAEHVAGLRNWQYELWGVLIFQAWLDEVGVTDTRPAVGV